MIKGKPTIIMIIRAHEAVSSNKRHWTIFNALRNINVQIRIAFLTGEFATEKLTVTLGKMKCLVRSILVLECLAAKVPDFVSILKRSVMDIKNAPMVTMK